MTEKTSDVRARFEAWHDSFYGPQDPNNPIRSLARFPEHMGLGYIDSVVQAQVCAFEGGIEDEAQRRSQVREDDDYVSPELAAAIMAEAAWLDRKDVSPAMLQATSEYLPTPKETHILKAVGAGGGQPALARILRDDDMVPVPRGLLGASLHAIRRQVEAPELLARLREYAYSRVQAYPKAAHTKFAELIAEHEREHPEEVAAAREWIKGWADDVKAGRVKLDIRPWPPAQDLDHKLEALDRWASALLDLAVLQEALTSRDSDERLKNMNAGEVMRRAFGKLKEIRAQHSRIAEQRDAANASFKNFHRGLCERFGYVHDEKDWQRDQVSLSEHIAKLVAQAGQVPEEWRAMLAGLQWHYEPYDDHWHKDAGHYCPVCGGEQDTGHKEGCSLAAMLAAAPQPAKGE